MKRRSVRGRSRWNDRKTGEEVMVIAARGGYADGQSIVMFVFSDDPDRGGVLFEEEFREAFTWVAGR